MPIAGTELLVCDTNYVPGKAAHSTSARLNFDLASF
jgi:hypothetical protein